MRIIIALLFCLFFSAAHSQKLGHLNSVAFIDTLAEAKVIADQIAAYEKSLTAQGEQMAAKFQQNVTTFQKQSLLKRRDELLKPLLDKINAALVALGKEENYLFIFDSSSGLLHFPAADNVSEKIAARISK